MRQKLQQIIAKHTQKLIFLLFVLLACIVFINNGKVSLWDQDEAAYAGFAYTMKQTGDYTIPQFMWSDIHRKPPLHFWAIALSFKIFGVNTFAVRFPAALSIFLTYLLIYLAGTSLWDRKNALAAVMVLCTTLFVPVLAKVSVTDGMLLFLSSCSGFAILHILKNKQPLLWASIFWLAFSLGLLLKGPPIVIFTCIFVFILFVLHPQRKNLLKLHPWFFLIPACLPFALWCYNAYQADGGVFINWLLDWYILKRIGGSVLGQTGPPGTHLLFTILFFMPWFILLPKTLWKAISSIWKKDRGFTFLMGAWFIAGWFIYELSPSKLPAYAVASHVPLAILIGNAALLSIETNVKPPKGLLITQIVFLCLISAGLAIAPFILNFKGIQSIMITITGLIMLLINILNYKFYYSENFFIKHWLIHFIFQIGIWVSILPLSDGLKNSSERVAEYVNKNAVTKSNILIGNKYGRPPSLPFYLGMHFYDIKEQLHTDSLIMAFESDTPTVLILNKNQKEDLLNNEPNASFEEVNSLLTDRKQKAYYYIFINSHAQKKK